MTFEQRSYSAYLAALRERGIGPTDAGARSRVEALGTTPGRICYEATAALVDAESMPPWETRDAETHARWERMGECAFERPS